MTTEIKSNYALTHFGAQSTSLPLGKTHKYKTIYKNSYLPLVMVECTVCVLAKTNTHTLKKLAEPCNAANNRLEWVPVMKLGL